MTDLEALTALDRGERLDQAKICQLVLRGYVLADEVMSHSASRDVARPRQYRVTLVTPKGKRLLEVARS